MVLQMDTTGIVKLSWLYFPVSTWNHHHLDGLGGTTDVLFLDLALSFNP